MTESVKQIRYYSYKDVLLSEHEGYWADIDDISRLIAYDLEGYHSQIKKYAHNTKIEFEFSAKLNTIVVHSKYEKEGAPIVLWEPANPFLVKKEYETLLIKSPEYIQNRTLEDFREFCYIQDCLHYRYTYFTMKNLFPHYQEAILDGAENKELLYVYEKDYLSDIKKFSHTEYGDYLTEKKDFVAKVLGWSILSENKEDDR